MVAFHGGRVDEIKVYQATCYECKRVERFESVNPHNIDVIPTGWDVLSKRSPDEYYSSTFIVCGECLDVVKERLTNAR